MKIGLIDIDSHARVKKWGATIYPNLALCKIAAFHRERGDQVEWYEPLHAGRFDKVYVSKIFNWSPDYPYQIDADDVSYGGTGYSLRKTLPPEIDGTQPDYSIYPTVPGDTAYGFLTRGCPNSCKWCVVPRKEGSIRPYWDIDRVANGKKKVVLMDNNILAAGGYCREQLRKIIDLGYHIDFNQALDARLVTDEWARLLARIKWIDSRIRFGCDTKPQIEECERAMKLINCYGYNGQYFLYTMLHGTIEECYERLHYWWERNHEIRSQHKGNAVYPYAQPYRDPDDAKAVIPNWQKDMARWCNKKMIFEQCDFPDFEPRKGFRCQAYLEQATAENANNNNK